MRRSLHGTTSRPVLRLPQSPIISKDVKHDGSQTARTVGKASAQHLVLKDDVSASRPLQVLPTKRQRRTVLLPLRSPEIPIRSVFCLSLASVHSQVASMSRALSL